MVMTVALCLLGLTVAVIKEIIVETLYLEIVSESGSSGACL